jgi:uncharacterized protein (DUF1501 family)
MPAATRREFLKIGPIGAIGAFGAGSNYKALVCVFLRGGMDGSNMVIPLRTAAQNYRVYQQVRQGLTLPERSLLPVIAKNGDIYGLHPRLGAVQNLFQEGKLAILANVGTEAGATLFSHFDQQEQWRRILPQGVEHELATVPHTIHRNMKLGQRRQVYVCTLGGFDTHGAQLRVQDELLAILGPAIGTFYSATVELGIARNVTLFTTSEFGRRLMPNSTEGSDHGWGNHHFIVGGAVNGGDVYGEFPNILAHRLGIMIPTTSLNGYGATLLNWLGGIGKSNSGFL